MKKYALPLIKSLVDDFDAKEDRVYFWIGSLLVVISLCVIWLNKFPPLQDFPYHLVRIHMMLDYWKEQFGFSDMATISLFPTPYILVDYLSLIFGRVFPILTAGKLILSTYIILLSYSIFYLAKALHHKGTPLSLFGFLLIFNYFFNMGLISFIFSIPFFLLAFGYWWKYKTEFTPNRMLILALLVFGVYLSHPFSFCFLLLVLFLLSIYFYRDNAKIFIGLCAFLPSLLLLILALMRDLPGSEINQYVAFFYKDPVKKLAMAFGNQLPYFTSFKPKYESIILGLAALVIFILFISQLRTFSRSRTRIGLLLAASLLLIIYLFLPDDLLLPNVSLVANRSLIFFAFILILLPEAPSRPEYRLIIALLASILVIAQISLMFLCYRAVNDDYADIYEVFEAIPENMRLAYWSNWGLSRYGNIYPIAHFNGYYYVEHAGKQIPAITAFAGPLRALQFKDQSSRNLTVGDILSEGCRVARKNGLTVLISKSEMPPTVNNPEYYGCSRIFTFNHIAVYRSVADWVEDPELDESKKVAQTTFSDKHYYKEGYINDYDYLIIYGPQRDMEILQKTGCYEPVYTKNNVHAFKYVCR